ncbi:transposable element tcb2 transposase [Trichonephila clavipes]|nr:transposable element tcb2 transposase [Trichonephila clavipes]
MGPLICLDTTQSGDRYVIILSVHVHPFMSIEHSYGLGEFQQDNATPHTSRITTQWLPRHSYEFRHFRWPPTSLAMNFIEYIWNALQSAVQKRYKPFLAPTNLRAAMQDCWCQLPPALLQTLVESMLRRVEALQRARGESTRY